MEPLFPVYVVVGLLALAGPAFVAYFVGRFVSRKWCGAPGPEDTGTGDHWGFGVIGVATLFVLFLLSAILGSVGKAIYVNLF